MTEGQKEYLEGYINTLELHKKREDTPGSTKVLYTGVIRGIRETIDICKKVV